MGIFDDISVAHPFSHKSAGKAEETVGEDLN